MALFVKKLSRNELGLTGGRAFGEINVPIDCLEFFPKLSDSVPAQCPLKILHKAGDEIEEFEAYLSVDNKGEAHLRHMTPVLGPEVKPNDFLVLRTVAGDSYEANIVSSKSLGGEALSSLSGSDMAMVFNDSQAQFYFTDNDGQLRDMKEKIDRTSSQNAQLEDDQASVEPRQIVHQHPLATGMPPDWASEWGHDEFGPWCSFQVEDARQVLRWIPAGQFQMGVSEEFEGLFDEDGPRHWVTLTRGFWMFESLCSRQLFELVTRGMKWATTSANGAAVDLTCLTARSFCSKLGELLGGVSVALPTDAQWEFACRAGRQDGPHFDRGAESTTESNPRGLRDILAGSGEFCGDGPREGSEEAVIDPVGDGVGVNVRGLPRTTPNLAFQGDAFRSQALQSSLPQSSVYHPSFREIVETNAAMPNVGFRCVIAEEQWTPAALGSPPMIEQKTAAARRVSPETSEGASRDTANDVAEPAEILLTNIPLLSLIRDMASHLHRYYTDLIEPAPGMETRWRLNNGHPLYEAGRRVVHAIPDSVPVSKGTPNFPDRGGRLWYILLRTSRRAKFEDARPYLITAARDLAVWLNDHYPNELPQTFVVGDIPFSLRLANLRTFLSLKDLSPSQRSGTGIGWFAEQHPLLNAAVEVLVAIPDVTTAMDGTPNFPDVGGHLWRQLRNSLASNADNSKSKQVKQRSRLARQFSEWVSHHYAADLLEVSTNSQITEQNSFNGEP